MILPAREWVCAKCRVSAIQTGPRASEILPTPPEGWLLIDATRTLPPRKAGDQKVGETRETTRKTFCPTCCSTVLVALEVLS